ncbi:MAG: DinB family protein [Candidatus Hodarchaeales archaeon]|jgi:uncharacterized damage-inducible protein DinB
MSLGKHKKLWLDRYERLKKNRAIVFSDLKRQEIESEFLITRPSPHQWSVDEIIRHILASEIRYVHQSFDPTRQPHPGGIRSQWVDMDTVIKLEEHDHIALKDLKKFFPHVEVVTDELLREASDMDFDRPVKAPWGEKMKVVKLLEYFYDHENYHRGQIYWVINYFKGPPKNSR